MKKIILIIFIFFSYINVFGQYIPEAYNTDVNNLYEVSPVRNQKELGTCWAFAPCASMEACALKRYGQNYTFSPLNIVNKNPLGTNIESGGNCYIAMSYLFNLLGPVEEKDDPYTPPFKSPYINPAPLGYSENVYILSDNNGKLSEKERKNIKMCVGIYGGVAISYCDTDEYYSNDMISYYCPKEYNSNHQVVIIGWDDNYSRNNFKNKPPYDGAFLIKGSWGTEINKGFVWISYYDASIDNPVCYTFTRIDKVPYDNIISYIKTNCLGSISYNTQEIYGKIIFKEHKNYTIEAIKLFLAQDNNITIKVFVNDEEADTVSKDFTSPGFRTIYLNNPIKVNFNDTVTLLLLYKTEEPKAKIPIEINQ